MNFYAAQDEARRATRRLVWLFLLSVLALVAGADLLLLGVRYLSERPYGSGFGSYAAQVDPSVHLAATVPVLLVILAGSAYKYLQFSQGGRRIAESVGARPVPPGDDDLQRRRLLNVVEEMAIAAGVPVPAVYLLEDEPGINAFAAGITTDDAVVCVTQGCLALLSREQLQGVVAHEFSHILNGDMRLNARVVGVLHGILLIGLIGEWLVRAVARGRHRYRSARSDGAGGLLAVGAGLMVIGYGGTFFGRLIKASLNRQREYLADASAVQFTRNPGGIGGALKMIGGHAFGSRIDNPAAPVVSHMFFASGLKGLFGAGGFALFATHPPLERRIRRIDPAWDGRYPAVKSLQREPSAPKPPAPTPAQIMEKVAVVLGAVLAPPAPGAEVRPEHVDYARELLAGLPDAIRAAAREPYSARALIYAMLFDADDAARAVQLEALRLREEGIVQGQALALHARIRELDRAYRLPIVELALPALRGLSPSQAGRFLDTLTAVIRSDRRVTLLEWSLATVITNTLLPAARHPGLPVHRLDQLKIQVRVILSVLAHAGSAEPGAVEQATRQGAESLGLAGLAVYDRGVLTFDTVDNALRQLDRLVPLEKERLLVACARVVGANRAVDVQEFEALRAVAAALHCPAPPIIITPGAG
ncbi:MAG: M48 family metallopeptidase [Gammaproteobacteria bacterium]